MHHNEEASLRDPEMIRSTKSRFLRGVLSIGVATEKKRTMVEWVGQRDCGAGQEFRLQTTARMSPQQIAV